jgi:nitroreductase
MVMLMSLIDSILTRRSIRRYENKDIPEEMLHQILEAGRQAPSAANMQPVRFVILKDYEAKRKLSNRRFSRFIKDSPVVIAGCANVGHILTGKWAIVDATIAMQNMVVAAWALGIGSCWIGSFDEKKVKQLLNIPKSWKVVALITFGYPDEQPKQKRKKRLEKLFSFNSF